MSLEMEYKNWLEYIRDYSYDRDGCKNAEDLGMLVDDLHDFAKAALKGENCPANVYNRDRDSKV